MENKEQVYSQDGQIYTDYNDLMDELKEFYNIGESVEVWEADKVEWKHVDFINVEGFIYDMQANAMDVCGEVAEEYLNEINEMQKLYLRIYISEWLNKNAKVKFHGIENNSRKIVVVE